MPTYSYACTACGHRFDIYQAFTDDALTECPECGSPLRKVYSSVGVVFKGSGFYRNDARGKQTSSDSSSSDSSSSSGSSGSGSGSSDSSSSSGSSSSDSSSSGSDSGGSKNGGSKNGGSGSGGSKNGSSGSGTSGSTGKPAAAPSQAG